MSQFTVAIAEFAAFLIGGFAVCLAAYTLYRLIRILVNKTASLTYEPETSVTNSDSPHALEQQSSPGAKDSASSTEREKPEEQTATGSEVPVAAPSVPSQNLEKLTLFSSYADIEWHATEMVQNGKRIPIHSKSDPNYQRIILSSIGNVTWYKPDQLLIGEIKFCNHSDGTIAEDVLRLDDWHGEGGAYPLICFYSATRGPKSRNLTVHPVVNNEISGDCVIFHADSPEISLDETLEKVSVPLPKFVNIDWIETGRGGLPTVNSSSISVLDQIMMQGGFELTCCICKNCSTSLYRVKPQTTFETNAPRLFKEGTQIELFNVFLCPDCGTFYAGVSKLDTWVGDPRHTLQLYLVSKRYDRDSALDIAFDLKC